MPGYDSSQLGILLNGGARRGRCEHHCCRTGLSFSFDRNLARLAVGDYAPQTIGVQTMAIKTNRTRSRHRDGRRATMSRQRRGAALVEAAITLPVFFVIIFALLDLGLAAVRYNALAEVSRRIAREAVLRGALTPLTTGTWGTG